MLDSLANSLAAEIFPPEGSEVNPMANMPHHRMVMRSYGYATLPWVGLTEDEVAECFKITPDKHLPWHIYKRIEDKLKEKNAQAN